MDATKKRIELPVLSQGGHGSATQTVSINGRAARHHFAPLIPRDDASYDVVLFYPTFGQLNFGAGWKKNTAEMPPLGPLYIATPLLDAGYRVRFCDLNVEHLSEPEFEELVRRTRIFGISFMTIQERAATELIRAIRAIRPDAFIIVGGHHCHLLNDPFPEADVTARAEAEEQIVDLVRAVENGDSLAGIPCLLYNERGRVVATPHTHSQTPLEKLPRPARHLVDPRRYGFLFGIQVSPKIAGVMSSRGCMFKCSFCIRSPYPPYRDRDALDVVEEMEDLYAEGYDTVIMADEYFLANRKRVLEMMDLLEKRGTKLRIIFQTRVNSVDDVVARRLKAGGVFAILFGIESGSAEVLKFYTKGTTVQRAREALEAADRAGIFTYAGFIIGAPIETSKHLNENIEFVKSVPLDFLNFNHLVYMAGSPLWEEAREQKLVAPTEYWVEADERFGGASVEQITEWRRTAVRKFYLRPGYFLRLIRKCLRVRSAFPLTITYRFAVQAIKDGTSTGWIHDN